MNYRFKNALRLIFPALALLGGVRKAAGEEAQPQPSSYTRDIRAQEAQLNDYLQKHPGGPYSRAAVIAPDEVDIVTAWAGLEEAAPEVRRMLADKNPEVGDAVAKATAKKLYDPEWLPDRSGVATTDPGIMQSSYEDGHACDALFVQADTLPPAGQNRLIAELGPETLALIINKHEGWHCKDRHDPSEGVYLERYAPLNKNGVFDAQGVATVLKAPYFIETVADAARREALGDVGGLGDAIREDGYGPELIDAFIRDFRGPQKTSSGPEHFTAESLSALKTFIAKVGLEQFRALSDDAAADVYNNIAENNGLAQPKSMRGFIAYAYGTPADHKRAEHDKDSLVKKGVAIAKRAEAHNGDAPPTPGDAFARVGNISPLQALKTRTLQEHGRLDPDTISASYQAMQEDLRARMRQGHDPAANQLLAVRLRTAFADAGIVKILDSVAPAPQPAPISAPRPETAPAAK